MNKVLEFPQFKIPQIWKGFFYLTFALLSVSSAAILVKFSEQEISFTATIFYRLFLTTIFLTIWQVIVGENGQGFWSRVLNFSSDNLLIIIQLIIAAICITTDLTIWSWSLTQTSVANATILANMTPLFTSLGVWLLWHKPFEKRLLIGIIIAVGGAITIALDDFSIVGNKLGGDLAALVSAIAFAVYLIIVERLQTQFNTSTIVLYTCAIGSMFLLPITLFSQENIIPHSWHGWLSVIALALICQIIGQGLLVYSLKCLSCEIVALSLLLEPVLAAIGAWLFFSETLSLSNWVGCAIVLLGMYLAISSPSAIKKELPI